MTSSTNITAGSEQQDLWTTGYTPDEWADYYARLGWTYPTASTVVAAMLRDGYYYPEYGKHWGVDFASGNGTNLKAAADGSVTYKGWVGDGGNAIAIKTNATDPVTGKKLVTTYLHMKNESLIPEKDSKGNPTIVTKNTLVGYVGNTGGDYGYHLHYQVTNTGTYMPTKSYNSYINTVYFYPNVTFNYTYWKKNGEIKYSPTTPISG
jgi:murein DD-endopeptidase MepM/ murein hydrolase activator NlpD